MTTFARWTPTFAVLSGVLVVMLSCQGDRSRSSETADEPSIHPAVSGKSTAESGPQASAGSTQASDAAGPERADRPVFRSVVLVTVDTLRVDRLGCYGARSPATPAFDRLAHEGTLFENALATNPLTLPSHASMLTGRSPAEHGVRGNGNFALPEREATLATILSGAGFSTAAFVGAFPLSYRFGLGRGFSLFDDDFGSMPSSGGSRIPRSERRAREVNEHALVWLRQAARERFFLWVHYFDPHFEYQPEEPYASRYRDAPYDGEVAATDASLGELLDELDRTGRASTTAVLVIADHGEGLGDHGEGFHGVFLYDSTIHVPFLIRAPGRMRPGSRIARPVSGSDVAPTILDLLGLPAPGSMSGRSCMGGDEDEGRIAESFGPWFEFRWSPLRCWRSREWKYIDAPEPELYDLRDDPGETHNLAQAQPGPFARARAAYAQATAALERRASAAIERHGSGDKNESRSAAKERDHSSRTGAPTVPAGDAAGGASQETIEMLRSLGYTASAVSPSLPPPRGRLRDPKTMRGFEEAYYRAFALMNAGRIEDAIASYRALLLRDPEAPLLHQQLARALMRLRRYEQAEHELLEALRLDPNLAEACFDLGAVREAMKDYATAADWFRKALALNPGYPEAHASLARRLYASGDLRGARIEMEAALKLAPSDPVYRKALESLPKAEAR